MQHLPTPARLGRPSPLMAQEPHLAQETPSCLWESPSGGYRGPRGGLSPLRCVFLGSTAHPLLSPPWHGLNAHRALGRPTPASPSSHVAPGGLCCGGGLRWLVWSRKGPATAQARESSWRAWLSALPCPSWVPLFFDLSVPLLPQIGFRCARSAPLLWLGGHRGPCLRPPPKVPTPPLGAHGLQLGPSKGGPPGGHWEPSPGGPGHAMGVGARERRCADMGVCVDPRPRPRCRDRPGGWPCREEGSSVPR